MMPGLIMFSVIIADASVTVFLPVVAMRRNIGGYTLFFTLFSVSTILTRLYFGRICTGKNRHALLISGMVIALMSFILIGCTRTLFFVAMSGILYGIGFGLVDPNLYTIIIEKRKDFSITQVIAGYGGFWDFGYAVGPIGMGIIYKTFGEPGLYTAAACSVFIGLIAALIYFRRGEHVELQKQCNAG
jgi:MFS family permease